MIEHKRYISVVHQIRDMIREDRLTAGSRIPSERELSERFGVARSSVREALRALELLGLIETRRGEGTFLRDFRDHHLIDLLGMFILQESRAVSDVAEVKTWLEEDAFRRVLAAPKEERMHLFEHISSQYKKSELKLFTHLKRELVEAGGNQLYVKIWLILNDFHNAENQVQIPLTDQLMDEFYQHLLSEDIEQSMKLITNIEK
ncbi:FadR/GntR family transcriptional regulator [Jeotgalibacillus haloalkalitolerans]|uniref:FadR/GntR family transcriptional regulator n=1 Tax=Jeotgalibacillus haloalkalitolerans TaxID=3104292 RepID=UPI002ACC3348|nr:GntR family transcriptional regulator [Jeotgalibacillus sp. HH7-29]